MIRVNVHEAKTNLSKLLKLVSEGETVQICNRNEPVANITPVEKEKPKGQRPSGLAKGQIIIHDSFFEPMDEEELALWYDGDIFPPENGK